MAKVSTLRTPRAEVRQRRLGVASGWPRATAVARHVARHETSSMTAGGKAPLHDGDPVWGPHQEHDQQPNVREHRGDGSDGVDLGRSVHSGRVQRGYREGADGVQKGCRVCRVCRVYRVCRVCIWCRWCR
mgnify:CR=1 FL=1